MWIEELPNGKYKFCERYEDLLTGKIRKVSLTNTKKTKSVQEEMFLKLQDKINSKLTVSSEITFKHASDEWINVHKENVKASTITRSKTHLRAINECIGDILIYKLTPETINNFFLTNMKSGRFSYNTAKQMLSLIKRIITFAAKYLNVNRIDILPFIEVPALNKNQKNDLKYLERDELERVIQYFTDNKLEEFKRMIIFQVNTGMRYAEMVSIDYDRDIDFDNHSIHIQSNYDFDNKIFTSPKTGNDRIIFFNQSVEQILKEQIRYDKLKILKYNLDRDNNLLFKTYHGTPIPTESLNRQLRRINIKDKSITTHYLRHTFITLAVENGMNKDLIAKQVGHADTNMIDKVYAHFSKGMENKQKEAMLDFKVI